MKYKYIAILLLIGVVLITISSVSAGDVVSIGNKTSSQGDIQVIADSQDTSTSQKTFSATGKSIGCSLEGCYPFECTKKAKKQLKQINAKNKKNPAKYSITLSDSQYNQLLSAKKQGKMKEIQIKTNKYIKIKKPVVKKVKKTIFNKKYYSLDKFDRTWKKFDEKYGYDNNYKIKVTPHYRRYNDERGVGSEPVYYKLTVFKKFNKIKGFKSGKALIYAGISVNNRQAFVNGKGDFLEFFIPQYGIDGTMASSRINIE